MSQSFEEIIRLAEQGMTACQIEVGNSYLTGRDPNGNACATDPREGRKWIERAHEKGASTATYILGTIYEDGSGVAVDVAKAIAFYTQAAERGSFLSCVRLARIYAAGKGVSPSPILAKEWYGRVLAAEGEVDDDGEMAEARAYLARTK
jgi:TPR repeat protein